MPSIKTVSLAAATLIPALVQGISFTSPASSDVVTKGSDITAKWTSVDTDPEVFSLYIWNFEAWPPYYEGLAYDINTSAGEFTVRIPCHVDNGEGWQLTAINNTNVYVLYAQTDKFNITGDSCTDPTTTSSYCPASTVYVTSTVNGAMNAAAATPTSTTSLVASTVSASVIKPGLVDGTVTSLPVVSAADVVLEAAVEISI
ncbi:hypothetical protein VP1G_03016 [Cytospora mali]|uniref:Yeast cell wall synthesis Kre9/Knh1-like N-terminal domain-containing protein n=1 Tax=Cytospora mali TaxID=578113 RepID=A0A194UVD3_CYTMA|nr:hypothetical protein VP1G_03016 [Valsa mali var. pyri (nom. inval.)]